MSCNRLRRRCQSFQNSRGILKRLGRRVSAVVTGKPTTEKARSVGKQKRFFHESIALIWRYDERKENRVVERRVVTMRRETWCVLMICLVSVTVLLGMLGYYVSLQERNHLEAMDQWTELVKNKFAAPEREVFKT